MLASHVRTSLRRFRQTKAHTLINVFGLALGFTCALIIFQKVRYESGWDRHWADADRVYRVVTDEHQYEREDATAGVPYPFADAFRTDFPDIADAALLNRGLWEPVLTARTATGEERRFQEERGAAFAEPGIFDVLSFEWVQGDPATALAAPRSAVIAKGWAEKYFGTADVVGRTLTLNATMDLTITGVIGDPPENTMLPLRLLAAFDAEGEHAAEGEWGSVSSAVQFFLKLPPGMTPGQVEAQLPAFIEKHRGAEAADALTYSLQPLRDVHFDTTYGGGGGPVVARDTLRALGLIGLFLLLTAGINFVNLNTVLVFRRAREVGVRKALGGTPRQIATAFMTEMALTSAAALGIALVAAPLVLSLARSFVGEGFSANVLADPWLALFAVGAAAAVSVGSGLYPAFLLSRLRPAAAVRGVTGHRPGAFLSLRRGLVVLQFAISQFLIVCTLATLAQMQHLRGAPLGFEAETVVEFGIPARDEAALETLKETLARAPGIEAVALSNSGASSGSTWKSNFHYEKDGEARESEAQMKMVDRDYFGVYGLAFVAGGPFAPTDSVTGLVANETFVRVLGFEAPDEALGLNVRAWHWEAPLVGVVRDFHTRSLHEPIEPTLIVPSLDFAYYGAAKVHTARMDDALAALEAAWTDAFPAHVYEHEFLDDTIAAFYESEGALTRLTQAFALVAILIGCIGLYGLVAYTTQQRAGEVGVRKVLGASAWSIVGLFSREFVAFVVVGFVFAGPAAYLVMRRWLDGFAYHIDLGAGLFALAFIASLAIALATVATRTYRAATVNPVDVIRRDA